MTLVDSYGFFLPPLDFFCAVLLPPEAPAAPAAVGVDEFAPSPDGLI